MSEGLLFLKPCPISRDGTPDFDVREGKPINRAAVSASSKPDIERVQVRS
jgi:hypothetical protein